MAHSSDRLLEVIPVHYSHGFPDIQLHQFPLLTRPLQVPPSASQSGKFIRARVKPDCRRLEVHVPFDTRHDVWNKDRGKQLGAARVEDDKAKNQDHTKAKPKEGEDPRLTDVRMSSEEIPQYGTYILGIVRDGQKQLHLHPIKEVHQFRPMLTYLDLLSSKNKRKGGDDSDSDDGPPPDPDEPVLPSVPVKGKKPTAEGKEVQMTARKAEDKGGSQTFQGGLSANRREMLTILRNEEEEQWQDLKYCDVEMAESEITFDGLFSKSDKVLECTTNVTQLLKSIEGL